MGPQSDARATEDSPRAAAVCPLIAAESRKLLPGPNSAEAATTQAAPGKVKGFLFHGSDHEALPLYAHGGDMLETLSGFASSGEGLIPTSAKIMHAMSRGYRQPSGRSEPVLAYWYVCLCCHLLASHTTTV